MKHTIESDSLKLSYYYSKHSTTNHTIIYLFIRMSNAKIIYLKCFTRNILLRSGVENSMNNNIGSLFVWMTLHPEEFLKPTEKWILRKIGCTCVWQMIFFDAASCMRNVAHEFHFSFRTLRWVFLLHRLLRGRWRKFVFLRPYLF